MNNLTLRKFNHDLIAELIVIESRIFLTVIYV